MPPPPFFRKELIVFWNLVTSAICFKRCPQSVPYFRGLTVVDYKSCGFVPTPGGGIPSCLSFWFTNGWGCPWVFYQYSEVFGNINWVRQAGCPPVLWRRIRKYRVEFNYQFRRISQVFTWLPWVVLGIKSFPADKVCEFVVLSLEVEVEVEVVFELYFPFFLAIDLHVLEFLWLSVHNQLRLVRI